LYTLQNWRRDPYLAYYFYQGSEGTDAAVNKYLDRVSQGKEGSVNLAFHRIDVSRLDTGAYTDQQREVWAAVKDRGVPLHVLLTPRRGPLFIGHLTLDQARNFVESPKRQAVAKQLAAGKQGVLVLLLGSPQSANANARRAVQQALAATRTQGQQVGFVEVARSDPREQGFVRQLLQIEEDLPDLKGPMVFGVFGRGHFLEPYVGRGITRDNLLDLVEFMNGPCSCDIKTCSTGMDLLTNFDWENRIASLPQAEERPAHSFLFDVGEDEGAEGQDETTCPAIASPEDAVATRAKSVRLASSDQESPLAAAADPEPVSKGVSPAVQPPSAVQSAPSPAAGKPSLPVHEPSAPHAIRPGQGSVGRPEAPVPGGGKTPIGGPPKPGPQPVAPGGQPPEAPSGGAEQPGGEAGGGAQGSPEQPSAPAAEPQPGGEAPAEGPPAPGGPAGGPGVAGPSQAPVAPGLGPGGQAPGAGAGPPRPRRGGGLLLLLLVVVGIIVLVVVLSYFKQGSTGGDQTPSAPGSQFTDEGESAEAGDAGENESDAGTPQD
ncbi:MAG: hypothetical protein J7M26_02975, partial [Armatimonadetes bacterium]|nr:hypothetical protein [Armatimonadota bacterium]